MGRNQHTRGWISKLAVFSAAATTAGLLAGAALGAAGSTLSLDARVALATILAFGAVAAAAIEVSGRRLRPLQCNRETPQNWMHSGPISWAVRNGAALGFGAATRIGFALWYLVPAGAFLIGNVAAGAVLYGTYAGTRALAAWLLILASSRMAAANFDDTADWLLSRNAAARSLAAAQLLLVGMATSIGVGL